MIPMLLNNRLLSFSRLRDFSNDVQVVLKKKRYVYIYIQQSLCSMFCAAFTRYIYSENTIMFSFIRVSWSIMLFNSSFFLIFCLFFELLRVGIELFFPFYIFAGCVGRYI